MAPSSQKTSALKTWSQRVSLRRRVQKKASSSRTFAAHALLLVGAFGTYFCMYAFRKPFAAGSFESPGLFGLELKTVFVISQVIGYAASKYLGTKFVSEASRNVRLRFLVGCIVLAEIALLGFALLPAPLKVAAILLNGLPLGMVWSLVVRYLEGRRASELLLSGLSCSFIVASGVVKDVGRALMAAGVDEYWMPAVTGALFLPAFALFASILDRQPEPDPTDVAARRARIPMHRRERLQFMRRFGLGFSALLAVYLLLTAFRDYRDNYGVELFRELGYGDRPGIFTATELPVALFTLVLCAQIGWFRRRSTGLIAVFGLMSLGLVLVGASTWGLQADWLKGEAWMILSGLGAYLAYVPFGSFLFDRLMAATRYAGTAVFAINVADAVGYTGSVGALLYKDVFDARASRLSFFVELSYWLGAAGVMLLAFACVFFLRHSMTGPGDADREPWRQRP